MDKNVRLDRTTHPASAALHGAVHGTYLVEINGQPVGPWVIEHISVEDADHEVDFSVWIGGAMVGIRLLTDPKMNQTYTTAPIA